ncbi:delta endotoxin C-terminal domain-containing protein [Bacillus cereus]|uniref:delta endotoxin C-terminal domain-containing protein n=1 Tax=Bacillus cereus TaxID=1396 RepID=UPI003D98F00F
MLVIISGPGFTGGDLVRLNNNDINNRAFINVQIRFSTPSTNYRVRYASTSQAQVDVVFGNISHQSTMPATTRSLDNLKYEGFGYFDVVGTFLPSLGNSIGIRNLSPNNNLIIDKFEFIPINPIRKAEEDLEIAKKAVANLFTRTRDGLQVNVTDYQVDQVANLVSCVSDEQFSHDKPYARQNVSAESVIYCRIRISMK